MRYSGLVLFFIAAFPAHASSIPSEPTTTDYMFQCAATYIIAAHAVQDADKAKSQLYRASYDRLARSAQASFEKYNRPRSETLTYLQQHIDKLSPVFANDPASMRRFLKLCDHRFPD